MSLQIRASFIGLAALTGSAMWTPAWAQSDVNLIDQRLAIAGGATPGDTPGYPITTSRPGSYRLSSNLNVPGGADGILITADGVTIDLNGSQINGTKNGDHFVGVNGGDQHRITVRNGGINNMGTGILINGSAAVIEGVTVANNAGNGIQVGEHCMISRNIVVGNSGDGIDAGRACIISGNIANSNIGVGILSAWSIVSGNVASFNINGGGITCSTCIISGNTTVNDSGIRGAPFRDQRERFIWG